MITLAQKLTAVLALAVVDIALLALGGVVFAMAALLATVPLGVMIVQR